MAVATAVRWRRVLWRRCILSVALSCLLSSLGVGVVVAAEDVHHVHTTLTNNNDDESSSNNDNHNIVDTPAPPTTPPRRALLLTNAIPPPPPEPNDAFSATVSTLDELRTQMTQPKILTLYLTKDVTLDNRELPAVVGGLYSCRRVQLLRVQLLHPVDPVDTTRNWTL